MHILCLQHVAFEGPGYFAQWARDYGHTLTPLRVDNTARFPELDSFDVLLVMGGPMSVHDAAQTPWMQAEKAFIKKAWAAGKKCLGVCLGGQLLAELLGGTVIKQAQKEIGWFTVSLTDEGLRHPLVSFLPDHFTAFHWHGETFSLPEGATPLMQSALCANQAFVYKNQVLAFQCHLEITENGLKELVAACESDLANPGVGVQSADDLIKADIPYYANLHAGLRGILNRFFA